MNLDKYRDRLTPYDQRIFDEMYNSFAETATQLLLEAGTEDNVILRVIGSHWNIPTGDIESILVNEKINVAVHSLEHYLWQSGYCDAEVDDFMHQHTVRTRLRHEHDLLMQWNSPEKLYKALNRKKK